MRLDPVESSMLAAIGYDASLQALVVLYNSGKAYQYLNVPVEVYQAMMEASSKGRYMRDQVIDHYPYRVFRGWKNLKSKEDNMAKTQSQEERQLMKMIVKLPVAESDKTAWLEQLQRGDMSEELAEAIRTRLNETGDDGAVANRSRYLVELANLVRRWRLSNQAHNFGKR